MLSACGLNNNTQKSDTETKTAEENIESTKEKESTEGDKNGNNESATVTEEIIQTTSIESPFGEDGNIRFKHTEKEIVEEHMDEHGRIYFPLNEYPIRNITSIDGKTSNITNYGDAFINIVDAKAYNLSTQEMIDDAYKLFISNPPKELEGKDPSEYRTWDKATNLERSIIQIIYLTAPSLNDLGYLIQEDTYSGEIFEQLMTVFEDLGAPTVLIPAPQTPLDIQLFDNMKMVQSLWGQLGQFENPEENKEKFKELYSTVRQEMNNILVRVNYTLSEDVNTQSKETE